MSTINNCYNVPERLFVLGDKELLSHEGVEIRESQKVMLLGLTIYNCLTLS